MVGADKTALDAKSKVEGYVWFTTTDGKFYIDWDNNGTLTRSVLNAGHADTAASASSVAWSGVTGKPNLVTGYSKGSQYVPIYTNASGEAVACSSPSLLVNLASTSADTIFESGPRPGVTGTLKVGNGGTGTSTAPSAWGIIYAASTAAYASTAAGTSGQYLKSNGNAAPSWASFVTPTVTWTDGTTAGPTLKIKGQAGTSSTAVAIPSATSAISGVVTTGDQTFAGKKTFEGGIAGALTGNVTGNATSADKFSSNATVAVTGDATGTSAGSTKGWSVPLTLANSGVTAGTYGTAATATLTNGGSFKAPSVTVDAKGRVTSASTFTLTLPTISASGLGAVTAVSASGTAPLTLGATKSGTTVSVTGSVATAGANSVGVVKGWHRTSGTATGTQVTNASNAPAIANRSTTAGRYYGVETDSAGAMFINVPWTDTNTKVTAVGNHYTPAADSAQALSVDASSTTKATWGSTSLVTGVNLQRDAAGHVTGVTVDSIQMPANPNSDTHHTAYLYVGASGASANTTSAVSDPYIVLKENGATRSNVQLKAGNNVSISGNNGIITISSTSAVTSVFGRTGAVTLTKDDVTTALGYTPPSSNTTYTAGTALTLSGTQFSVSSANVSTMMNLLGEGTSAAQLDDYLIAQYAGGGTTTTTYHRRKVRNVINATVVKAALGTGTGTTKYLREDGTWVAPPNTTYSAGTGLSLSSNKFSISTVPIANGGTGATSAAGARSNLAVVGYTLVPELTGGSDFASTEYLPTAGGTMKGALTLQSTLTGTSGTFSGNLKAATVQGAVWNDYAEYRELIDTIEPGRCVVEVGDDKLIWANGRLAPCAYVISDTFGFSIGETEKAKAPVAVAGRVLAYPYEDRNSFNIGDAVCSGPNGTVSKMTRQEIMQYPERIIGTVSSIPSYGVWENKIVVNDRIWIKIK